jgi:hypothetical protein
LLLKGHGEQHPWVVAMKQEIEGLKWYPRRPRPSDCQRGLWQLTVQAASAPAVSIARPVRAICGLLLN